MNSHSSDQADRQIKSFVRRCGRMTASQKTAYATHWLRCGIEFQSNPIDTNALFGRSAPLVLEIGFGMGQSLLQMAVDEPDKDFIGVEVHRPGIGKLMHMLVQQEISNIRVMEHDAVDVLKHCVRDESLSRVQIYFPDPWHKTRHHKRRLIQMDFVELLCRKLKQEGVIHIATDWSHYAEQILSILQSTDSLNNCSSDQTYVPRPSWRPVTKFERRGERLGHGVWDLVFQKN